MAFVVLIALTLVSSARAQSPPLEIRKGDHIVFLGNTMAERLQQFNYFETMLMARFPDLDLVVRNSAGVATPSPCSLGHSTLATPPDT